MYICRINYFLFAVHHLERMCLHVYPFILFVFKNPFLRE